MIRWMRGYRKTTAILRVAPLVPFSGEFQWPNLSEIATVQKEFHDKAPKDAQKSDFNLLRVSKAPWIPDEAIDLKLRLLNI